jgi:radical SAM protein with 4Fe4S-binding SPASM domain
MMISKYIDPYLETRKAELKNDLKDNPTLGPSVIELNIIAKCNRSCFFCPISDKDFYKINNYSGRMEKDFFNRFVDDLKSINFSGKILFAALSEPLLHKDIGYFISILRKKLNNVSIEVVTNGDVLNASRLKNLFESGLNTLNISMYDGKEQIQSFEKMIKEAGVQKSNVILRRRYLEDGNYGITLTNKCGAIDIGEIAPVEELPLQKVCYYPFYHMMVDFNGDVMPCPHDWQKKGIIGNLNHNSIMEVWTGKKEEFLRRNLSNSNRNIDPCKECDVPGDLVGEERYKDWKKSHKKTPF